MQEPNRTPLTSISADPYRASWLRRLGPPLLIALLAVCLDQGSKAWALSQLPDRAPIPLMGSWLELSLVANTGAAFSIGGGRTLLMTCLAVAITAVVLFALFRPATRPAWRYPLAAILGGSLGNLIDRFGREPGAGRGAVVDFIKYHDWFVGNVADIFIVLGAVVLVLMSWRSDSGEPSGGQISDEVERGESR